MRKEQSDKRKEPSDKMIKARELRLQRKSLDEIGEKLAVTRQGARYLLLESDRFFEPKIGTYKDYKKVRKYLDAREPSLQAP